LSFDYHHEMTEAVSKAPRVDPDRLVWIMNDEHRARFCAFQEREMGVQPDVTECFGIPIETGEPSNGQPFELVVRPIT
jgi:hypothetical protein